MNPSLTTEAEVLEALDRLRQQRAETTQAERAILAEIKETVRQAGALRVDGEPINRSVLIERSGLSRRTAYQILETLEPLADQ